MFRIGNASNFRRTLAALCLLLAPLAFGGSDLIRVYVEGAAGDSSAQLAAIADKIGLWKLAAVLNMIGVVLFVPAILGLMHLLRRRSVVLGHIGGSLAIIGILGFAAHNPGYYGVFGALSTSDITTAQQVQFIEHMESATPSVMMYVLMFLLGFLLGPILLGIGLYRARTLPRWTAGLFTLGMGAWVIASFSPAAENLVALTTIWGLIAAGLGAIGLFVLRMPDADWESLHEAKADPLATAQPHASASAAVS